MLTFFALGSLGQVSLSSSAVINFVCCNAKLSWVCVQVRVLVSISEEKSGLDTYCILMNLYPNVKLFKVHLNLLNSWLISCSGCQKY